MSKERRPYNEQPIGDNRADAKRRGLSLYYGNPCKRGHSGVRRASSGSCLSCDKELYSKKLHTKEGTSRMVDIDHMEEQKHDWLDDYYAD